MSSFITFQLNKAQHGLLPNYYVTFQGPANKLTNQTHNVITVHCVKGALSRYCTITLKSLKLPMHQWKP